jgi:hypothetical protein
MALGKLGGTCCELGDYFGGTQGMGMQSVSTALLNNGLQHKQGVDRNVQRYPKLLMLRSFVTAHRSFSRPRPLSKALTSEA